jgi:hypothetical protein
MTPESAAVFDRIGRKARPLWVRSGHLAQCPLCTRSGHCGGSL